MTTFTSRAELILANAKKLDEYIVSSGIHQPSFENDTLARLPIEAEDLRSQIVDEAATLKSLAQGVNGATMETVYSFTNVTTLRLIYRYNIPALVPLDGSAAYSEIASRVNLPLALIFRSLRHAMSFHVFRESSDGKVAHTATSRALVEDPEFFGLVGMVTNEFLPASSQMIRSFDLDAYSEEPNHTGYALANDTDLPIYLFLANHPTRMKAFEMGMRYFTRDQGYNLHYLLTAYPWSEIDKDGALMVDVGGGFGSCSQYLAKHTRHMRFIVQDLNGVAKTGAESGNESTSNKRVDFMGHDFFKEQPVKGADVYFLRWILHNWSDAYCTKILKQLIPAMKNGSRIFLYELLLPDEATTSITRKQVLDVDMVIQACFNGQERRAADWQALFESADKRFKFDGVATPSGSRCALIKAVWDDSAVPSNASVPNSKTNGFK